MFDAIHRAVMSWIDQGGITGLRIDHPDGLADPLGYFQRSRRTILLQACQHRLVQQRQGNLDEVDWPDVAERLRARYRTELGIDPASPRARPFPIVAEKILSRGEELPDNWPIDGTVGYEFLNTLNGLFVDPAAAQVIEANIRRVYRRSRTFRRRALRRERADYASHAGQRGQHARQID